MRGIKLFTFLFINFFLIIQTNTQIIKNVFFMPNTNLITNDPIQRDGIVLVTLNTSETTSICNYKFDQVNAGIVCKTLGFPQQGLSIIDNIFRYNGSVLLANFQCTGLEANLSYCVNSGRSVQPSPCANHTMDVHVYCLQQKVPPVVTTSTTVTICNKTSRDAYFTPNNGLFNIGRLQILINNENYSVCNDDFSFTPAAANYYCNLFCNNLNNPSAVMPFQPILDASTTKAVRVSCYGNFCNSSVIQSCFQGSFFVGIQCGPEPQIIESPPNVTCTSQQMFLYWAPGFIPPIYPYLVTLSPACSFSTTNSSNGNDTAMYIPFNSCPPTITGDTNNVYFTYTVNRSYNPIGNFTPLSKTISVVCAFPKNSQNNNSFGFNTITPSPLNGTTPLPLAMQFYSDNGYSSEILNNGLVNSNQLLYVKVYIVNPPKNISLSIQNCYASTVNNMSALDVSNSVLLIKNTCPESLYNVVLVPYSRSELRFQFMPYLITRNSNNLIYVLCSTSLCYLNKDAICPYCVSRKKRSAIMYIDGSNVDGWRFTT